MKCEYIPGNHRRGTGRQIDSVGVSDRGSRKRAATQTNLRVAIFIIKDIFLRYLTYGGIIMVSLLLYLIAVPQLGKKGLLDIHNTDPNQENTPKKIMTAFILELPVYYSHMYSQLI